MVGPREANLKYFWCSMQIFSAQLRGGRVGDVRVSAPADGGRAAAEREPDLQRGREARPRHVQQGGEGQAGEQDPGAVPRHGAGQARQEMIQFTICNDNETHNNDVVMMMTR